MYSARHPADTSRMPTSHHSLMVSTSSQDGEAREQRAPKGSIRFFLVEKQARGQPMERAGECKGICPPNAFGRKPERSTSRECHSALNVPSWPHLGRDDRLLGADALGQVRDLVSLTCRRSPCPAPEAGLSTKGQG
jgi:hypothetical protein